MEEGYSKQERIWHKASVSGNSLVRWRERKKAILGGEEGRREMKSENLVRATRAFQAILRTWKFIHLQREVMEGF